MSLQHSCTGEQRDKVAKYIRLPLYATPQTRLPLKAHSRLQSQPQLLCANDLAISRLAKLIATQPDGRNLAGQCLDEEEALVANGVSHEEQKAKKVKQCL